MILEADMSNADGKVFCGEMNDGKRISIGSGVEDKAVLKVELSLPEQR